MSATMIAAPAQWSEMINPPHREGLSSGVKARDRQFDLPRDQRKARIHAESEPVDAGLGHEGEPVAAAGRFALHRDVDAERPGYAEKRQVAGHADAAVVNPLNRFRDEVDQGELRGVKESRRTQIIVEWLGADVDRLRLHVESHAAAVRMVEID